jgi:hypothetical protein
MSDLRVYVPAGELPWLAPGSAIVGQPFGDHVLADYEGNLYGAENIKTYADRALHAAGRHVWKGHGYPTVARRFLSASDLVEIGVYDTTSWSLYVGNREALASWLGISVDELGPELRRTDGDRR